MIDIYRIKFPKEKLREFSSEERSLLFLLGYAANQIAVFKKLVGVRDQSLARRPACPIGR